MPFLAPLAGALLVGAGTVVATVGGLVGSALVGLGTMTGIGALATAGYTIGGLSIAAGGTIALGGMAGLSALASITFKALSIAQLFMGTPSIGAAGQGPSLTNFHRDPNAPIPYMIGECATSGFQTTPAMLSDDKKHTWSHRIVTLSGCGPIHSIDEYKMGEHVVTPDGAGKVFQANYKGKLWMTSNLGVTHGGWVLTQPMGTGYVPEWTNNHKQTGYAAVRMVMEADTEVFPNGSFDNPVWTGKWVKTYDPRKDSTYPGGVGGHRWNDEATWEWSENGPLHGLTWALGRRQNGFLIMGLGLPIDKINVAEFVEAANIFEANGWKIAGRLTSHDNRAEALTAIMQASGALPLVQGRQLSCLMRAPRVAVASLTSIDIVGPVSRPRHQSKRSRVNKIIPRCVIPEHNWELTPCDPYKVDGYIAQDGIRQKEVTFPLVKSATQATQIAAMNLYDSYEFQPVVLTVDAKWGRLRPGMVISVHIPEKGLAHDLMVLDRTIDPDTMKVSLTCRSESQDKYEEALNLTGAVPDPNVPTLPDPREVPVPDVGVWTASPANFAGPNGQQIPGGLVVGSCDNPSASAIVVSYWPTSGGPADGSRITSNDNRQTRFELRGLNPGQEYQAAVAYMISGVQSESLLLQTFLVPNLIAGDTINVGGVPVAALLDQYDQTVEGLFTIAASLYDRDQVINSLGYVAGQPINAVHIQKETERLENETLLFQFQDLIGAKSEDGLSIVLNSSELKLSPTQSLAQSLSLTESELGNLRGRTEILEQSVTAGDRTSGLIAFKASAGEMVTSLRLLSEDGPGSDTDLSVIDLGADIVRFNGKNPFIWDSATGTLKIHQLEVDGAKIKNASITGSLALAPGTVITGNIATDAIHGGVYSSVLASNTNLPAAASDRIRYLSGAFTKQEGYSDVRVSFSLRPRPGASYAGYAVVGYSQGGVDTTLDTVWYWTQAVSLAGLTSNRMPMTSSRRFYGLPAGSYTMWLDFVSYVAPSAGAFMEAGSYHEAEELKR